ncbi:MAG: hypothetical protein Q8L38_06330, partial [Pseudohongiella sp.]|nr:hypothetical protein [Pseudohongiella sp.]
NAVMTHHKIPVRFACPGNAKKQHKTTTKISNPFRRPLALIDTARSMTGIYCKTALKRGALLK